jgi:hypothetical protein
MPFGKQSCAHFDFVEQSIDDIAVAFGIGGLQKAWIAQKSLESRCHFTGRFHNRMRTIP